MFRIFNIWPKNAFNFFFFEKAKFLKAPVGFELLTYIFSTDALNYWGTLLGKMHVKENTYKIKLGCVLQKNL